MRGIGIFDKNTIIIGGFNGPPQDKIKWYRTENSGASWNYSEDNSYVGILDIDVINETTAIAVSYGNMAFSGVVLKTTDAGKNWSPLYNVSGKNFHRVDFVNEQIGYVAGTSFTKGFLWSTTDGGTTWDTKEFGNNVRAVTMIDADAGYFLATPDYQSDAQIYKTTDGGENWEMVSQVSNDIENLIFIDINNGFGVGEGGKAIMTTDGGASWVDDPSGIWDDLNYLSFGENYIYASGSAGKVLRKRVKGAVENPEISVDLTDNTLDFGEVEISSNSSLSFEASNSGDGELVLTNLSEDLGDEGIFRVITQPEYPHTLASDEKAYFEIEFNPNEYDKDYSGSITISSNAANIPELTITIKGKGVKANKPEITIDLQDNELDYGSVDIGFEDTLGIEIKNTGSALLSISDIEVLSEETGIFEILNQIAYPIEIAPEQTKMILLTFKPIEPDKDYAAEVVITSDAANEPELKLNIKGKGGAPNKITENFAIQGFNIEVSPIPVDQELKIKITSNSIESSSTEIRIISLSGEIVKMIFKGRLSTEESIINYDATSLNPGFYFIIFKIHDRIFSKPVIIN